MTVAEAIGSAFSEGAENGDSHDARRALASIVGIFCHPHPKYIDQMSRLRVRGYARPADPVADGAEKNHVIDDRVYVSVAKAVLELSGAFAAFQEAIPKDEVVFVTHSRTCPQHRGGERKTSHEAHSRFLIMHRGGLRARADHVNEEHAAGLPVRGQSFAGGPLAGEGEGTAHPLGLEAFMGLHVSRTLSLPEDASMRSLAPDSRSLAAAGGRAFFRGISQLARRRRSISSNAGRAGKSSTAICE